MISPAWYVAGALAIAGTFGGLAALAVLVPLAAAAVFAAFGAVMVLIAGAAAFLAFQRDPGGHGGGQLAGLPRLAEPGRYTPPRNPDRPTAAHEGYVIPDHHDARLREWH